MEWAVLFHAFILFRKSSLQQVNIIPRRIISNHGVHPPG
jgi:hypothetical protein